MFFILLLLATLSYEHAKVPFFPRESVLITCNAGCGCVTETRVAVACPFIKSSETTVMRAIKPEVVSFRWSELLRLSLKMLQMALKFVILSSYRGFQKRQL